MRADPELYGAEGAAASSMSSATEARHGLGLVGTLAATVDEGCGRWPAGQERPGGRWSDSTASLIDLTGAAWCDGTLGNPLSRGVVQDSGGPPCTPLPAGSTPASAHSFPGRAGSTPARLPRPGGTGGGFDSRERLWGSQTARLAQSLGWSAESGQPGHSPSRSGEGLTTRRRASRLVA